MRFLLLLCLLFAFPSLAQVPTQGTFQEFTTAITVSARNYNTAAETFGNGNRTVIVPAGTYLVGKFEIFSNTIVLLEPGAIIKDSGQLPFGVPLISIRGTNVKIVGHGAKVIANRADYLTGEHRHGIMIYGGQNVLIEGLESSGHGGDGFYIGGPDNRPSTDVVITGCAADNNRRQGMSIVNAARVFVADCQFTNTQGTWPMFGLDLEPNNARNVLQDIHIVRPRTSSNYGGGIVVGLSAFGPTAAPASISIYDHVSTNENPVYRLAEGFRPFDSIRYLKSN